MSNSIWKTPDQKPENGQHILFFAGGCRLPYLGFYSQTFDIFEDWKSKDIQKWANVLDLIAQANKAERLEKAVNSALISLGTAAVLDRKYVKKYTDAKIDLIKQLIKGE